LPSQPKLDKRTVNEGLTNHSSGCLTATADLNCYTGFQSEMSRSYRKPLLTLWC
jgi:hypothetical protein